MTGHWFIPPRHIVVPGPFGPNANWNLNELPALRWMT
jgi:hypothetical protein